METLHTIQEEKSGDETKAPKSLAQMMNHFFSIAVPTVMQCFLQRLTMIINTIFVGRLNDVNKLAGVGLATTISAILCITVIEGINGA